MISFKQLSSAFLFFITSVVCIAQSGRTVTDISGYEWKLWLDTAALWQNDPLFVPGTAIDKIPINSPTGGWDTLYKAPSINIKLPATVEQYYWGRNGNTFGVSGNYLGVSWFYTKLKVPQSMKGKHVTLNFESVRFRAEVFVNKKLVGYDLVNGTPFDVDISKTIIPDVENDIAIRITDPNGNFDWRDSQNFMWGDYRTQPTHGFGGITGKIKLVATDAVFIKDVFIKNKPQVEEADVVLSLQNNSRKAVTGTITLQIKEFKSGKIVWQKDFTDAILKPSENTQTITIKPNDVKLWDIDNPFLYSATVIWKGSDNSADKLDKRFGFRWFEIKDINGDKQYYLNGKRIVIRTSISWGFWPVNGIAPSDELARKQVEDAKKLGLNTLNFHRTIGQTNVLDYADELGLLYYEEPGGNQYPENLFNPTNDLDKQRTDFYLSVRNEKFFRMIKRDRSHPSLIIYNLHNERGAQPYSLDREEMTAGHKLDETRIMTYNSSNGSIKQDKPDPRFKLHLLPYDTTFNDYGWFDQHHAGGPGSYHDNLYNNPQKYAKYINHKDEIIYYGEEGAIGTPPRLQLIRDEILKTGKNIGWESDAYLKWYDAYDEFIRTKGFIQAFPNVDSLTRKMGNVAYYYQGRIIENVRISNIVDGYAVNGWESMKLENHSGIVDNYRNLKGDPSLIARYNQPIYIAVKLNHKVLPLGDSTTIDLFIVNEKNLKGSFDMEVQAINDNDKVVWTKNAVVSVTGGIQYGELLLSGLKYAPVSAGYTKIRAWLKKDNTIITQGDDELYAVSFDINNVVKKGQIADTSGILDSYFKLTGINSFSPYKSGKPEGKILIVGAFDPPQTGNPLVTDILEWVNNGNTLLVLNTVDKWASYLAKKEAVDYKGLQIMGTTWYGGNFFVKNHPLFEGLPQSCVFNWEYQCFAGYNKSRIGMRIENGETVVGCVSDHKPEVYSALSIVPHGRGRIILCSLDIFSCIKDSRIEKRAEGDGENAAMNTFNSSLKNPANIVAHRLLINMIKN